MSYQQQALPLASHGRSTRFLDKQRLKIFQCLCIARHICGLDDSSNVVDIKAYRATLRLLEPHRGSLGLADPPTLRQVRYLWSNFSTHGCLARRSTGRPKLLVREEIEFLSTTVDLPIRAMTSQLRAAGAQVSRLTVHRIVRGLNLRFYRSPIAQALDVKQIEARHEFAHSMLRDIQDKVIDNYNISFSDECLICLDHGTNRQNVGVW